VEKRKKLQSKKNGKQSGESVVSPEEEKGGYGGIVGSICRKGSF